MGPSTALIVHEIRRAATSYNLQATSSFRKALPHLVDPPHTPLILPEGLPSPFCPPPPLPPPPQALLFAESRQYHAMKNNCIHFADFAVRLLTAGRVRGAPLLYDLHAGQVPPVDNPMLHLMSAALKTTWQALCDGTGLTRRFLVALRNQELPPPQKRQRVAALPAEPPSPTQPTASGVPCGGRPDGACATTATEAGLSPHVLAGLQHPDPVLLPQQQQQQQLVERQTGLVLSPQQLGEQQQQAQAQQAVAAAGLAALQEMAAVMAAAVGAGLLEAAHAPGSGPGPGEAPMLPHSTSYGALL